MTEPTKKKLELWFIACGVLWTLLTDDNQTHKLIMFATIIVIYEVRKAKHE